MRQKIVYILGLSHVGSTLLDLTLGSHPRFIGLGEIFQMVRPDFNRFNNREYCSCGKVIDECLFWGKAAERLRKCNTADIKKRYGIIIETFKNVFSDEHILVDSSKLINVLENLATIKDFDIKVIYLIRDVRAWTLSRLDTRKKSSKYFQKDGYYLKKLSYHYGWKINAIQWIIPHLTKTATYFFLLWYYQNLRIKKYLETENLTNFCLGYDELGMNPDVMVPRLFSFLGEENNDMNYSPKNSQSHIIVGNANKNDPKRRQGIVYDNRWLYNNKWILSAALFPNIMKYNAREVYRNIKKDSIWHT